MGLDKCQVLQVILIYFTSPEENICWWLGVRKEIKIWNMVINLIRIVLLVCENNTATISYYSFIYFMIRMYWIVWPSIVLLNPNEFNSNDD